jgi:hypothetical protein
MKTPYWNNFTATIRSTYLSNITTLGWIQLEAMNLIWMWQPAFHGQATQSHAARAPERASIWSTNHDSQYTHDAHRTWYLISFRGLSSHFSKWLVPRDCHAQYSNIQLQRNLIPKQLWLHNYGIFWFLKMNTIVYVAFSILNPSNEWKSWITSSIF